MQERQVRSLGQGHPLEKEMATHSSILAWEISWTEEPGEPQSMGSKKRYSMVTKQQQLFEIPRKGLLPNKGERNKGECFFIPFLLLFVKEKVKVIHTVLFDSFQSRGL